MSVNLSCLSPGSSSPSGYLNDRRPAPQRITQRDVAKAANLHFSTVSLALSNSHKVNAETREQVLRVARALGYERDPMLAALASYRKGRDAPAYQGEFAWIVHSTPESGWRQRPGNGSYFDGAQAISRDFGYRVSAFDLKDYPRGVDRLATILRNRGVRGVFLCPETPDSPMLGSDLGGLPAVAIGFALRRASCPAVAVNRYGAVLDIIEQLAARGHRRIGFAIPKSASDHLNGISLAAFLLHQNSLPADERVVPYLENEPTECSLRLWLKRERPTAVIAAPGGIPRMLTNLGVPVPARLSIALLSLSQPDEVYAGIDECPLEVGRRAAELLVSQAETTRAAQVGRQPEIHLVRGIWRDGASCAPVAKN